MAFISIAAPARDRLAAIKGVTIIDQPLPSDPAEITLIIASVRNYTIRAEGSAFSASFHIGAVEHLLLADSMSDDRGFAAVLAHTSLIGHLPAMYSPAIGAAQQAAADVFAAFCSPSLAAAAKEGGHRDAPLSR